MPVQAVVSSKLRFAELGFRDQWDMGCEDWPVDLGVKSLNTNPDFEFRKSEGTYRLLAQAYINADLGEAPESLFQSVESVFYRMAAYPNWILPHVNRHPVKGTQYFIRLDGLKHQFVSPSNHLLTGPFRMVVGPVEVESITTVQFRVVSSDVPDCPFFKNKKVSSQKLIFRMLPRPDILEWLIGEAFLVEAGNGVELRARVRLKPSPLIYRLLPELVIMHEMQYRGEQMLLNFIDFRRQQALADSAESSL